MWTESLLCTLHKHTHMHCMCATVMSFFPHFSFPFRSIRFSVVHSKNSYVQMCAFFVVHRTHCCRHHSMLLWYIHTIRTALLPEHQRWMATKEITVATDKYAKYECEKREKSSHLFFFYLRCNFFFCFCSWMHGSSLCGQCNCCFWMQEEEAEKRSRKLPFRCELLL